ncbi:MAG: cytochrome c oxidase accessory protein CcoG [Acidobacteriota bacterium]
MNDDRRHAPTVDEEHQLFRDALASVQADGRRRWIYARKPSGSYYRARTILSWGLLGFLFLAPFVRVGGQPLILLNVIERRFVLLGLVFWPQDFYLVVLLALALLVTIVLATTTIGRVWCGWLCPQTIFLEMLFRKIEYVIDGSAEQQLRRDRALAIPGARPSGAVIARRVVKHAIFFALSFAIANLFLAYVIGTDALWTIVTAPPREHLGGLVAITIFSLLFYGVFARFREQACTLACPYGRVMSALQDAHTIMVTYDSTRGEPRGRATTASTARGDCIDCGQCVTVCPTGIDIRNGIQLECVNCTACMDACDSVMTRVERPKGLIRLTSHEAIRTGRTTWLTARVKAYAVVWTVLVTTVAVLIATRPDLDILILRQPGTLSATAGTDTVANFYSIQVINRTNRAQDLEYRVTAPASARVVALGPIEHAGPNALLDSRLLIEIPTAQLTGMATPVTLEVRSGGKLVDTIQSSFIHPSGGTHHSDKGEERGEERR